MARNSKGRVRPPEEIAAPSLRPVASPVETYVRPESTEVDVARAKAQYIENAMESVGRPLAGAWKQEMAEMKDNRDKAEKMKAAVEAQGTFVKWVDANAARWSGLDAGAFNERVNTEFEETFKDIGDPLMRYALNQELLQYTNNESQKRLKKSADERDEMLLDNFIAGRAAELRQLHERKGSQEDANKILEASRGMAKEMGLPVDKVFTRLLDAQVGFLDNIKDRSTANRYIYNWFTAKNPSGGSLADTNRYEYNFRLDKIRNVLDNPTKAEFETAQNQVFIEAKQHIEGNVSDKTFEGWLGMRIGEGMMTAEQASSFRNQRKAFRMEATNKANMNNAIQGAMRQFLTTNVMPTGVVYQKADGEIVEISKDKLTNFMLPALRQIVPKDQHGVIIDSKIKDPALGARLVAGYNSMQTMYTDKRVIEREITGADGKPTKVGITASMAAFLDGVNTYQQLKAAGGDAAVDLQVSDSKVKQAYEDYLQIKAVFGNEKQAVELVAAGNNVKVDQKALNAAVSDMMGTSNFFTRMPWFGGEKDAENAGYVKETLKINASRIMAVSGLSAEQVLPGVREQFERSHFKPPKGNAYIPWTPEMTAAFPSKEIFSEALMQFGEAKRQEWVKWNKETRNEDVSKRTVQIMPVPGMPNRFVIRTETGARVSTNLDNAVYVTTDDIKRWWSANQATEANKARNK